MSEEKETTKGEAIFNMFMTCLFIGIFTVFIVHGCTNDSWQREAVEKGAAEWKANPKTFRPEFKWKDQK